MRIYSYDLKQPQQAYVRLDLSDEGQGKLESFSVDITSKE